MTSSMQLLPPHPDACQVCARDHEPDWPHDAQSLYWATSRHMRGLGPASWELALAHVKKPMRDLWVLKLGEKGVEVSQRKIDELKDAEL